MAIRYRVKFETYDDLEPNIAIKSKEVMDEVLSKPTNSLNYGMGQKKQIELIQVIQDNVLSEKTKIYINTKGECPKCKIKLSKYGTSKSRFWLFDI